MNQPDRNEILRRVRAFFRVAECLHPDAPAGCSGRPIAAHSVRRATHLTSIAKDGHVVSFTIDVVAMMKSGDEDAQRQLQETGADSELLGMLSMLAAGYGGDPRRVGLREASTFLGFCGEHDGAVFAPIETQTLNFTPEQCFLLAYRAVTYELLRKKAAVGLAKWSHETVLSDATKGVLEATMLGLNEIEAAKAAYDERLTKRDFSELRFAVWELDDNPRFAASGYVSPEVDFLDNPLQDIADFDMPFQHTSVTVLPQTGGGNVVVAWIGDQPACRQFTESLISLGPGEWPDAFLRLCTESVENLYFDQEWFHSLDDTKKAWVKLRVATGGFQIRRVSYKPDGVGFRHYGARLLHCKSH